MTAKKIVQKNSSLKILQATGAISDLRAKKLQKGQEVHNPVFKAHKQLQQFLEKTISHLLESIEEPEYAIAAPELIKRFIKLTKVLELLDQPAQQTQAIDESTESVVIDFTDYVEDQEAQQQQSFCLNPEIATATETEQLLVTEAMHSEVSMVDSHSLNVEENDELDADEQDEGEDAEENNSEEECDSNDTHDYLAIITEALAENKFSSSNIVYFATGENQVCKQQFKSELENFIQTTETELSEDDEAVIFTLSLLSYLYDKNYLDMYHAIAKKINIPYEKLSAIVKDQDVLLNQIFSHLQVNGSTNNMQTLKITIKKLFAQFQSWNFADTNNNMSEVPGFI